MARPRFQRGELLRLWAPGTADGDPLLVRVEVIAKSCVWVLAPGAPLEIGDPVLVERAIAGDARYQGPFEVVNAVRDSFALLLTADWERVQTRNFVRVATRRLPVEGIWCGVERPPLALAMLDLSVGGMRVECREPLEIDDTLECRFRLPDCSLDFAIPARVVRVAPKEERRGGRVQAGLEFGGLPDEVATELTRWIFRAQIRRNNTAT